MARILAGRAERSVHLDADTFFEAIVADRIPPWKPEAHDQNRIAMRAAVDAAATYAEAGYLTILDGIVIPGWFFEPVRDALRARGSAVSYVVLRPSLDEAICRSRQRTEQPMDDAEVVRQLWDSFAELGSLERHVVVDGGEGPEAITTLVWDRFAAGELAV